MPAAVWGPEVRKNISGKGWFKLSLDGAAEGLLRKGQETQVGKSSGMRMSIARVTVGVKEGGRGDIHVAATQT